MRAPEWKSVIEIESRLKTAILEKRLAKLNLKDGANSEEVANKYYYALGLLHGLQNIWDERENYIALLKEGEPSFNNNKTGTMFPNPYRS